MKEITMDGRLIGWQDKPSPETKRFLDMFAKQDEERAKKAFKSSLPNFSLKDGDGSYVFEVLVKHAVGQMTDGEFSALLKTLCRHRKRNGEEEQPVNK